MKQNVSGVPSEQFCYMDVFKECQINVTANKKITFCPSGNDFSMYRYLKTNDSLLSDNKVTFSKQSSRGSLLMSTITIQCTYLLWIALALRNSTGVHLCVCVHIHIHIHCIVWEDKKDLLSYNFTHWFWWTFHAKTVSEVERFRIHE